MSASPVPALRRPLDGPARDKLRAYLGALLRWQRDLARWPGTLDAGSAAPFVSLYASRGLVGCAGVNGGDPTTRIARAFLASMHDARFPAVTAAERSELRVELSFVRAPRRVSRAAWDATFEAGAHGGAIVSGRAPGAPSPSPVLLLPEMALARTADAAKFLAALVAKSGRALVPSAQLFLFETECLVVYPDRGVPVASHTDAAAAWLAGLIDRDGAMVFEVDGRTAIGDRIGVMMHARVAVALAALAKHGGFERRRRVALRRLTSEIGRALSGDAVDGWPTAPASIAGTLALASMAGAPVKEALREAATWPALRANAWHAAQVVTALGTDAPAALWKACVDALEHEPWAPWTALAARARGDDGVLRRTVDPLVTSVREVAPHAGGVCMPGRGAHAVPELALTAVVIEALATARSRPAAAASKRGRAFLRRWQCLPDRAPGLMDLRTALGAFPATPIHGGLRVDVTGHALLALLA